MRRPTSVAKAKLAAPVWYTDTDAAFAETSTGHYYGQIVQMGTLACDALGVDKQGGTGTGQNVCRCNKG